jgi:hypothetical protein
VPGQTTSPTHASSSRKPRTARTSHNQTANVISTSDWMQGSTSPSLVSSRSPARDDGQVPWQLSQ